MHLDSHLAAGRLTAEFPLPPDLPFTLAMAADAGVARHVVRSMIEANLVRRNVRGVYVGTHVVDDVGLRARSLALVVPADCVVVDRHAGWMHGAVMTLAPGEHVEARPLDLFRPAGHGRLRATATHSGERELKPGDITTIDGVRVTTPIRTALDLGRVRRIEDALTGLDQMMRLEVFTRDELLRGVHRFARRRWVTTLRTAAPLADGRSESPPESIMRLRCHECGPLPTMTPQLEVRDTDGNLVGRLDLGNENHRIGIEYDGAEWHTSPEQRAHDRQRRDAMRRLGWTIHVFTAAQVFGHHRTVDAELMRIANALHQR